MDDDELEDVAGGDYDGFEPLFTAVLQLPRVSDDVWLTAQAGNIARVNAHIAEVERELYGEYWESENDPAPPMTALVSALTQMWIFALYELVRTARQIPPGTEPDPAVVNGHEALEPVWKHLEGVRVTLAKHERPGRGKERQKAEMPGYARVDGGTGGVLFAWQEEGVRYVTDDGDIEDTGASYFVSRRSLVEGIVAAAKRLGDDSS